MQREQQQQDGQQHGQQHLMVSAIQSHISPLKINYKRLNMITGEQINHLSSVADGGDVHHQQ